MAIIDLGTQGVNLPYEWVAFDPVILKSDRYYALYAQVSSVAIGQAYSVFSFRFRGQIIDGFASVAEQQGLVEAIEDIQVVKLRVDQYWDDNVPLIIECQRRFFFSEQSNLADTNVNLKLDPAEDYKL